MTTPVGSMDDSTDITTEPSGTYRLDMITGRVSGHVDGIDAVKQVVYKILRTDRFAHMIYSGNFGNEIDQLGEFASQLERWVHEALTQDDRIDDITDFRADVNGDQAVFHFTVVSAYGRFNMSERRVTGDV